MTLWVVASLAAASPTPAEVASGVAAYNAHARFPLPDLNDGDLRRLAEGKLVRRRDHAGPQEPMRVTGLILTDHSRESLWVAIGCTHDTYIDGYYDIALTPPGPSEVWYGYLDLPKPFTDRHWVIDVVDNVAMAQATDNRAWEHYWTLTDGGIDKGRSAVQSGPATEVTLEQFERAIYTPTNHGAWLAIRVDDRHTLLGYHVTSVIGGMIPDRLVAEYSASTLKNMLNGILERAPQMLTHYDADHVREPGGDGKWIEPFQ